MWIKLYQKIGIFFFKSDIGNIFSYEDNKNNAIVGDTAIPRN